MLLRARHDLGHARLRRSVGVVALVSLALLLGTLGCTKPPNPLERARESLAREFVARTGSTDHLVVPFDVDLGDVERARELVTGAESPARRLADMLGRPDGFDLRYEWATSGTARDTLAHGGGNCLALSSVLIGLARGLGLDARYLLVRLPKLKPRLDGDLAVYADHIATVIYEGSERIYVDYSGELGNAMQVRAISDIAATAHWFTNQGYERIHEAHQQHTVAPWPVISQDFELATRLLPHYAWGWNNLGVARARVGDEAGAVLAYEYAIALDARMTSAHVNLAALYLRTHDLEGAAGELEAATDLNPSHPLLDTLRDALEAARNDEALREPL